MNPSEKANYGAVHLNNLEQVNDMAYWVEAVDRVLEWANGYMIQGCSPETIAWLKEGKNHLDLMMAIEAARNARLPKKHPTTFFLIPWSVGYECRVHKPEQGFSIEVIDKAKYDKLRLRLAKALEYVGVGLDPLDTQDALNEIRKAGE